MLAALAIAAFLDRSTMIQGRTPPTDINKAVTYVIAEGSGGTNFVNDVLPKISADVVVRAWFRWHETPPYASWSSEPQAAHRLGALFGGGTTCSALYDGENGLTQIQINDMATRDPAGHLVNAWGLSGIRHGTLSNPKYIEYLFNCCKVQVDAGADYLFMDERNAALSDKEGYDDYSLRDFAQYLQQNLGWSTRDGRWRVQFGIDTGNRGLVSGTTIASFNYRRYLELNGLIGNPASAANRLYPLWAQFRVYRDDRAFKALTDEIRSYASSLGRQILISGNGLDPYVDLQVLGIWNHWVTTKGHIDMSEDQIPVWRSIVDQGHTIAGKIVPVVLFHDWGFGDPGFPFLAIPVDERAMWMRTRGAEIYAAGGFFAFPVIGPSGCDAARDGTLPLMAELMRFYRAHPDIYTEQEWLGQNGVAASCPGLSVAASWISESHTLAIHVINRNSKGGSILPQAAIDLSLPLAKAAQSAEVISPDAGVSGPLAMNHGAGLVRLPTLQAYSVVLLHYDSDINLSAFHGPPRYYLDPRWERGIRTEFRVDPSGHIENVQDLEGIVQGQLHGDLRNPPVFQVNFPGPMRLRIHVRAVARTGARLTITIAGGDMSTLELPDLDGKDDPSAKEYDKVLECKIPAGAHRICLDDDGPDWAVVDWIEFATDIRRG